MRRSRLAHNQNAKRKYDQLYPAHGDSQQILQLPHRGTFTGSIFYARNWSQSEGQLAATALCMNSRIQLEAAWRTSLAAARSSIAIPTDLKIVVWPTGADFVPPKSLQKSRLLRRRFQPWRITSPDSLSTASRGSTTSTFAIPSLSTSRHVGLCDPTVLT